MATKLVKSRGSKLTTKVKVGSPEKAPSPSIKAEKRKTPKERWVLKGAPPGQSNTGIFHGGLDKNGQRKVKAITLVDGAFFVPKNLSKTRLEELRKSLIAAGFESRLETEAVQPAPVEAEEKPAEKKEERVEEFGGGTSYTAPLTPLPEAPEAIWILEHPDADGGGPEARVVINLHGREVLVELVKGRVETHDKELRDHLIACQYRLVRTEPYVAPKEKRRKRTAVAK